MTSSNKSSSASHPDVDTAATASTDMAEVKNMLKTLLEKTTKQDKLNTTFKGKLKVLTTARKKGGPRGSIGRFKPHALSFLTPRTTRRARDDLPPPPQIMNATPEQVDDATHVNPPASGPTHVNLRETRTENCNLPIGKSHTQIQRSGADVRRTQDLANEEEDPYWIEHDRLEQERRAQHQAQQEEMTKLRAQMERAASDLKMVQSQVHRVTSRAP
ncbi:hypothetical protein AALP_AAs62112U000200 [Arabis alpina]|uniref:Uncharacterized protein n=1 Tax=Arabis alpina TaxID=50452 RepID=A0A087G2D5_ARAAL|nr:hypothetical protein AALP_AAs62112U000200 [Arabis alpina]